MQTLEKVLTKQDFIFGYKNSEDYGYSNYYAEETIEDLESKNLLPFVIPYENENQKFILELAGLFAGKGNISYRHQAIIGMKNHLNFKALTENLDKHDLSYNIINSKNNTNKIAIHKIGRLLEILGINTGTNKKEITPMPWVATQDISHESAKIVLDEYLSHKINFQKRGYYIFTNSSKNRESLENFADKLGETIEKIYDVNIFKKRFYSIPGNSNIANILVDYKQSFDFLKKIHTNLNPTFEQKRIDYFHKKNQPI